MSARFDNKVVAITGAATGLGRATALAFLEEGAGVALLDLDLGTVAGAADALRGNGEAVGIECNVMDGGSVRIAFAAVAEALGPVDVLVNNAGVSSSSPFVDLAEAEWDRVMDVNAKGTYLCAQAVLPSMLERGSGAIVNVSSQAAKNGQPLIAHYCASKAAVIGLTRALALELGPPIRVNAVCPGVVDTEMLRNAVREQASLLDRDEKSLIDEIASQIPLGRLQQPHSVAEAILYLAAAEDVTGQALNVSGGMVMD